MVFFIFNLERQRIDILPRWELQLKGEANENRSDREKGKKEKKKKKKKRAGENSSSCRVGYE